MDRDAVRDKVAATLAEIADQPDLSLSDSHCAGDFGWWDSLVQLRLLVALEKELKVRFKVTELNEANNVGELIDLLQRRMAD